MTEEQTEIINKTANYVKEALEGAEGGHDWWHILRVWNNAKHIGEKEDVDMYIVELGALLHDIADSKFHNGDEEIGPATAKKFLESINVDEGVVDHVENIVKHVSYKNRFEENKWSSPELKVVQDADKLDALGAIGIGRTFVFGGHKNRPMWNPEKPPINITNKEEYKNNDAATINHFYEKLLLLKDLMNTKAGKEIAEGRHKYMEDFLDQFYAEWDGKK